MKNVKHFSDKQLYQLCIGCACLQLSLFRSNSNTDRQVQFICKFFSFPFQSFAADGSTRHFLCRLHMYSTHQCFVGKSDRKLHNSFLLLLSPPCKLCFCSGVKGKRKGMEKRIVMAWQYSLLSDFGCFYFRSLAMGISLPPLTEQQQNPRLPHLVLTATADAVTRLPGCCLQWG